jgi:serine/threonine-protein kinase
MANSPAREAVDVGSVIADTYKIEALLGRGGMGAVFLASHKRLAGKHVAIKILHTEIEDTEVVARFKREAEIAARLNHPNIVGVIDYNVAPDGTPYLVLDYLEGETLAQAIARGPMALDQVLSIVRQVGSGLAAAHRAGIVHRDLKPQNIFLVPTEVDGRLVEIAKVLDFGISKIRGSQTVKTQDSALLGTPQYMAPEQAMGQHASVDERTDVFALGAIVYEMLSGQPAFSGASIPEVVFKVVYEQPVPLAERVPAVPPAIAAAVTRAMAKPSDERFATVTAFAEAITGQPLTLTRGQVPAPAGGANLPSAARRVATNDAFARTMGSGDHGDSPLAMIATAAPGVPGSPMLRDPPMANAPIAVGTARSAAGAVASAPGAAASSPVTPVTPPGAAIADVSTHGTPRPHRRPARVIAAIVLAGVAAAAAMYLVMRDHGPGRPEQQGRRPDDRVATVIPTDPNATNPKATDPKATDPNATNPKATDPKATDPKATDSKATDPKATDPKATDPKATDAKATDPKATDSKPSDPRAAHLPGRPGPSAGRKDHGVVPRPPGHDGPAVAPPDDEDDDAREKLAQANAALERRDYDAAERLATAVVNSPAGPRQRAAARLIHGTVQCVARNDQEAAQIDLRNLVGFRALRAKLLAVCRNHGILGQ